MKAENGNPIKINGPAHLIEILSEKYLIDVLKQNSVLVWLSADRKLVDVSKSSQMLDEPYVIQLEIFPEEFPISFPPQINFAGDTHLLDYLLLTPTHWKSAICENENCCPPKGKPWSKLNDVSSSQESTSLQADFNNLIFRSELGGQIDSESVTLLSNLRFRDAWLVYLVSEPSEMEQKVNHWIQILEASALLKESHILLTLRGILSYLQNDRNTANSWITQALRLDSEYRLAQLVNRALENDAPLELVIDSFRAVTYEKLKLSPPTAA